MPDTPIVSPSADDASEDADFALPPLSDIAMRFLASEHYQESNTRIKTLFGLTDDDLSFLNEMDHMVLGNGIGLDGYIRALRAEFPSLDEAARDKLIGVLLADRFVPWGDRLKPSAKAAAQMEKVTIPPLGYYAVYDGPLSAAQVAAEVVKMVGIPMGGDMQQRLAAVVASRATGVRVPAQAEAQMMRPMAQGGLQLEPEQARRVVIAMGDVLGRVTLAPSVEEKKVVAVAPPLPEPTFVARPAPRPEAAAARPPVRLPVPALAPEEDEKEVAAVAARMPSPSADAADAIDQAVRAVMKTLTDVPQDPMLVRRLEQLVRTRLRNVRSQNEVFTTLMRGAKVGGLGLERPVAEALTQRIEEGYASWHEGVAAAEALARDMDARLQAEKIQARKAQEAADHAAWYAEKVKGKVPVLPSATVVPAVPVVAPGQHPLDAAEKAREEEAFGSLVPAPVLPKAPSVKVSADTVAPAASFSPRPRMDDVQPGKPASKTTLVGPAQELSQMSLMAFRRAGKTPEVAATHVRNLAKLLADQGFTKRTEAIQAWQKSPLQAQYVGLVADAFSSGMPLKDLLAKKRAAGDDVPSDEEVAVLLALNRDLRL